VTPLLYRLGQLSVRHRRVVVAVWIVLFVLLAVAARSVGPDLNDNLTLPGSDSQKATNRRP
jgi:putative drug exporter of the RND superfamily